MATEILCGVVRIGDRRYLCRPACDEEMGGLTCTEPIDHPYEHIASQKGSGIVIGIWYSDIQRGVLF